MQAHPPLILAIGGHDPSGGAGISADIETLAAHGCRALSVVTALTTQNTCGVLQVHIQPAMQIIAQCRLLLDESQIVAIKIGLLGNAEVADAIADLLAELDIPVVLDPILAAGTGQSLADNELQQTIRDRLLAHCAIITPNSSEVRILSGCSELTPSAKTLLQLGCAAVLVTGTHETDSLVVNRLYDKTGLIREDSWPRLAGSYHGSGCTLASAIAAGLALGQPITMAVEKAQHYTWNSLDRAFCSGRCQFTPNRFDILSSIHPS